MSEFRQVCALSGEIADLPEGFRRRALNGGGSAVGAILAEADRVAGQAAELEEVRAERDALLRQRDEFDVDRAKARARDVLRRIFNTRTLGVGVPAALITEAVDVLFTIGIFPQHHKK